MTTPLDPSEWNILVLVTDQERRPRHWPSGWAEANLPAMQRLKANGLDFTRAYTPASMCGPARSSFLTSSYPQQHWLRSTFGPQTSEYTPDAAEVLPMGLRSNLPNVGQLLASLGFEVAYKGKWHVSLPLGGASGWTQVDIDHLAQRYGFPAWNPPDAGNSLKEMGSLGGGKADNDSRYVTGSGGSSTGLGESVLKFLSGRGPNDDSPFALFVNLVNPHDVFVVPEYLGSSNSGYTESDFWKSPFMEIGAPPTWGEDLSEKPEVQRKYHKVVKETYKDTKLAERYNAFYGYLTTLADQWIGRILDKLEEQGLTKKTLIFRFADHGEMALSHNLVEKAYNAYEETIGIPFVVSNPELFGGAVSSDAFISTLDLAPTLAGLFGAPAHWNESFRGRDFSEAVLADPKATIRDDVLFCFDDNLVDDISPKKVATWLRALRKELNGSDWMYAVYFRALGDCFEFELYNLSSDPLQLTNLAHCANATSESEGVREQLHAALLAAQIRDGALPDQFVWPAFEPIDGTLA